MQRRITELRDSGVLHFDIDTDRARLGLPIRTQLWLTVPPVDLATTGRAPARHAEVAFAAAITGTRDLCASVSTSGTEHRGLLSCTPSRPRRHTHPPRWDRCGVRRPA
ncbi:hypothetical protein [Streptomyces sp. NPDC054834]